MSKTADNPGQKHTLRTIIAVAGYFLVTLISIAILFICAGSLGWLWGWAVTVVLLGGGIIGVLLTPGLIEERSSITSGNKRWDMILAPVAGRILPIAIYIVAGLDFRFGWSEPLPVVYGIIGVLLLAAGFALTIWAMHENKFFSYIVRIQKERGHYVVDTGPYHFVRHPGYTGLIIFMLAQPLALMSWWSLIPAIASGILLTVRTALEDATLKRELEGYPRYAQHVRYRLLPGIW